MADRKKSEMTPPLTVTPEQGLIDSGAAIDAGFYRAVENAGEAVADFRIGGKRIRLVSAGAAMLLRLSPALSHLGVPREGNADLTIRLWDSATAGVAPPKLPWLDLTGKLEADVYQQSEDPHGYYSPFSHCLSLYVPGTNQALFWTGDARKLPGFERGAPFRWIVQRWFREQGLLFIHAGCVSHGGVGALLVGTSGSGKSTVSFACLRNGFKFVSDDHLLLELRDGSLFAHGMYASCRLSAEMAERLQIPDRERAEPAGNPSETRYIHFLHDRYTPFLSRGVAARALFIVRRTDSGPPRVLPASHLQAALAFVPTSMIQLSGFGSRELALLKRAAGIPRAFLLDTGPDPNLVADVIRRVLMEEVPHES